MTKQKGIKIFGCILIILGVLSIAIGIWQGVFGNPYQSVPMQYDWTTEDFDKDAITLDELKDQSDEQESADETDVESSENKDDSKVKDEPSSASSDDKQNTQEEGEENAE